jgi:hypothetical protein
MFSNGIQYIQTEYSDSCFWIAKTNEGIVKEYIEPLLVETCLTLD